MGNEAKISVELEMLTARADKALDAWVRNVKKKVPGVYGSEPKESAAGGGAAKASKEAGAAVDAYTAKVAKSVSALKQMQAQALAAWRAANPGGVAPGQKIVVAPESLPKGSVPGGPVSVGPVTGGGLATAPPKDLNPGAVPSVVPGSFTPKQANTISSMVNDIMNKPLSSGQTAFVKFSASIAAMRVAFGLVSLTVRMALAPFEKLASMIRQSADNASRLYASSLQSGGMPIRFTAFKQTIAKTLGVGEAEVFQYGNQVVYLSKRLRTATETFASTSKAITELNWKTGIMKTNWSALTSEMSVKFAFVTNNILTGLNAMIERAIKWLHLTNQANGPADILKKWKYGGDKFSDIGARSVDITRIGQQLGVKNPGSNEAAVANAMAKMTAEEFGKKMNSWRSFSGKGPSDEFLKHANELFLQIKSGGAVPNLDTSARRYQTSSWERMGLVVGAAGGDNPAKKTASNTAKMVQQLERMIAITQMTHPELYRKPSGAMNP